MILVQMMKMMINNNRNQCRKIFLWEEEIQGILYQVMMMKMINRNHHKRLFRRMFSQEDFHQCLEGTTATVMTLEGRRIQRWNFTNSLNEMDSIFYFEKVCVLNLVIKLKLSCHCMVNLKIYRQILSPKWKNYHVTIRKKRRVWEE